MRVGLGVDSRRFDPATTLVLGGTEIEGPPGLAGHPDGDAVARAVVDAVVGAAGLGSADERFPDEDAGAARAGSMEVLASAVRDAEAENFQVVNADVSVVTRRPAVAAHADRMERALAERLHVDPARVSVKAKDGDAVGWIGPDEGMASVAVVLLDRRDGAGPLHGALRSGG